MKNLLFLVLLILFSNTLKSQIGYSAGIGLMLNHTPNRTSTIFGGYAFPSSYVTGGIVYPYKKIKLSLDGEWNRTIRDLRNFNRVFSGRNANIDYIKIRPGVELKPVKEMGFKVGTYVGMKLQENRVDASRGFGFTIPPEKSNIAKLWDYGFSFGGDIYFTEKISLNINWIFGSTNIVRDSFEYSDGRRYSGNALKTKSVQFGIKFHFLD